MKRAVSALVSLALVVFSLIAIVPASVADDANPGTSLTDNYGYLNGSNTSKQGFQSASTSLVSGHANFTVEGWFRPSDTATSNYGTIIGKVDSFVYALTTGLILEVRFNTGSWLANISTDVQLRLNEWQHLAFVKEGTTMKIFVNGALRWQKTDGTNIPANLRSQSQYISLGGNPWNGSSNQPSPQVNFFAGGIDEVKIWSTARTQAEIISGMNSKIDPSTANLLMYWDFNGASSAVINDRKGNLNLGVYGGATFPDVKEVSTSGSKTIHIFSKSYLNGVGGWKIPSGQTKLDFFLVGGGGGGGSNVGGGGGGGSGYVVTNVSVTSGQIVPLKVGVGGFGGRSITGTSGITWDGTNFVHGQRGESSTISINNLSWEAGGGGGGRQFWASNICLDTAGPASPYSVGGVAIGTGGVASVGALGGSPSTTQSVANGGTGFQSSFTGAAEFYGSGGGAGGGYQSRVAGVGGNSKGGNGASLTTATGQFAVASSGAGGGGGGVDCGSGGNGGSGLVAISFATNSAEATNISSAQYRTNAALVVTTSSVGKVTFYAMGKRIPGCINVSTISSAAITATCTWKPWLKGTNQVYAILVPSVNSAYTARVDFAPISVSKRSGTRS